MPKELVNIRICPGDMAEIEYTSVDERKRISAWVSCCNIRDGKGIAVFHTDEGEVYTWRPSKSDPHGTVSRIDTPREDVLINPYVRVFSPIGDKYRPADSRAGTYRETIDV